MLSMGLMSHRDTKPQIIVNDILNHMGVDYINEYPLGNYAIDNYLTEHSLYIEVMGDYWHCSPMRYSNPINNVQSSIILRDVGKRQYIENNGGYLLYLWEKDIIEERELCEMLISLFIEKRGELDNYNSFNYFIDKNGELKLKTIISSFQELQLAAE